MIRYRTLFQVDVAHDYFLNRGNVVFEAQASSEQASLTELWSVSSVFDILPDESTLATLRGHKMIFRTTAAGFFAAVQLDSSAADLRPLVSPGAHFKLTFTMRLTDRRFANYTELGPTVSSFYRFGNDSQNSVSGTTFLSRPVAAFDPSRRYVAGETYSQASGATFDLFASLRDTGPAAAPVAADWNRIPADTWNPATPYQTGAVVLSANRIFRALVDNPGNNLGNAAQWQPVGTLANQYVTVADATLPVGGVFNLDIGAAALVQATVRLLRSSDGFVATEQTFTSGAGVLGSVQIDLRGLNPDLYRLDVLDGARVVVPGRSLSVYLSPDTGTRGSFGVIEIGRGTGDFALLNPDGTLRSPRYALRFLTRATRWRYIFPAAQAVGAGAEVAPEAGDNRVLVTSAPRPLTRFGIGSRLQADSAATPAVSEEILLPAPEANLIRREIAGWFSETHVANLTVGP